MPIALFYQIADVYLHIFAVLMSGIMKKFARPDKIDVNL